jgi:hypothetical protein
MYLINKPLDAIDEADIENLKTNKVAEQKLIDYKEKLPGNSDGDKKEFLYDVSSFANASGGDLIYGIKEIASVPTDICGLSVNNLDAEIRRLESIIQSGLEPRIPGVALREIEVSTGNFIIIIRVPKSWAAPHMVKFGGSSKFYSRTSKGKYPLDVAELRAAFVATETVAERIRNFRAERLGNIIAGETPVKLEGPPFGVLHLIPIRAFDPTLELDISSLTSGKGAGWLSPIDAGASYRPQFNFDGLFTYSRSAKGADAYVQVFRNGIIEAVTCNIVVAGPDKALPSTAIEQNLISSLPRYLRAQQQMGVEPPVFVMFSLLGVLGYTLAVSFIHRSYEDHPIDRDAVLIPDVLVENFEQMPEQILRPIFDVMWNSAGFAQCENYDSTGKWRRQ